MGTKQILADDVLAPSGLTESDCLVAVAFELYGRRRITIKEAMGISRLSRLEFKHALEKRKSESPRRAKPVEQQLGLFHSIGPSCG